MQPRQSPQGRPWAPHVVARRYAAKPLRRRTLFASTPARCPLRVNSSPDELRCAPEYVTPLELISASRNSEFIRNGNLDGSDRTKAMREGRSPTGAVAALWPARSTTYPGRRVVVHCGAAVDGFLAKLFGS
ncbi:hypothetical protein EVAR_19080_1 [Eumeta japonica]|uniref:Uncharacterized protein n=1 Tax=Eumeta variegata TaxID=151549 RepID=A0A4C1UQH4_EUMVA|nr:hypothetical protein EVAR_19080_1 [Eumeta japonica]